MSFPRTLAHFGVIAAALAGPALAAAEAIPGPPLGDPAIDAGAVCPLPASAGGSAVSFAAGVAIVAIAAHRRRDLHA